MSFSLIGPFSFGSKVTSAQFNQLDTDHANALDKSAAGDSIAGTITFTGAGTIFANAANSIIGAAAGGIKANIAGSITSGIAGGITPGAASGIKSAITGGIEVAAASGLKTTSPGGIQLAGGSTDWIAFSTPRTVVRQFLFTHLGDNGSAWSLGNGYAVGTASATQTFVPIYPIDNSSIVLVAMTFAIGFSHANLPGNQPSVGIFGLTNGGSNVPLLSTGGGIVTLAAGTTGAYYAGGAPQSLLFTPDQNALVDRSNLAYYALVTDENGSNSMAGNKYFTIEVHMTVPDLRYA